MRTLRRKSLWRIEAAQQGHEYMLKAGRLCVGTMSHSGVRTVSPAGQLRGNSHNSV